MSSSQSLTTNESLGFRALVAAIAAVLSAARWLAQGVQNLREGDKRQRSAWSICHRRWKFAPFRERPISPTEPVYWFDTSGKRVLAPDWPRPLPAKPSAAHCQTHADARQAAVGNGAPIRLGNLNLSLA
jgi:hypothetical protein